MVHQMKYLPTPRSAKSPRCWDHPTCWFEPFLCVPPYLQPPWRWAHSFHSPALSIRGQCSPLGTEVRGWAEPVVYSWQDVGRNFIFAGCLQGWVLPLGPMRIGPPISCTLGSFTTPKSRNFASSPLMDGPGAHVIRNTTEREVCNCLLCWSHFVSAFYHWFCHWFLSLLGVWAPPKVMVPDQSQPSTPMGRCKGRAGSKNHHPFPSPSKQ